jgi:hypothetical protein
MFSQARLMVAAMLAALVISGAAQAQNGRTLDIDGVLDRWSPVNRAGFRSESYKVFLEKGVTYTIDMKSNQIDSYLILTGPNGLRIEDDNSGGNLDARIVFRAQRSAWYWIRATSFLPYEMGSFRLTVQP